MGTAPCGAQIPPHPHSLSERHSDSVSGTFWRAIWGGYSSGILISETDEDEVILDDVLEGSLVEDGNEAAGVVDDVDEVDIVEEELLEVVAAAV